MCLLTLITEKVFAATIYWDATNKEAILVGDERHGITMDAATHEYLHNKNGAVFIADRYYEVLQNILN